MSGIRDLKKLASRAAAPGQTFPQALCAARGPYHCRMTETMACDVAIVGSGLVGSALACALDGSGLNVMLIEAQASPSHAGSVGNALDRRNLALAKRSVETLTRLGVWSQAATQSTAIRDVHVSRRGDFGKLRLAAGDLGLEAFGYTVPAPVLGDALEARLAACTGLQRLQPATLVDWREDGPQLRLAIDTAEGDRSLTARVIVAADGTDSKTRERAGIGVARHDYAQTAIVGSVTLDREHQGRAFERFLDDGLVAMLPLAGRACGFVWAMPVEQARLAMDRDDAAFLGGLQDVFGQRLGAFRRLGKRQAWPLRAVTANALIANRLVLVGNAAQTVHPVGAQGFNLGLRDAVTLAAELICAHRDGRDIGCDDTLERHARRRQPDRDATIATSDSLITLFGSSNGVLRFARSAALAAADRIPVIKRGLARRGMGYRSEGAP